MSDFCFIIPSYCKTQQHLQQLRKCLSSIRQHHDNYIIINDDFSDIQILEHHLQDFENIEVVTSWTRGGGDMTTYHQWRWMLDNYERDPMWTHAVIMQDSMNLEAPLENVEDIETIKHLWYFTNHRLHWSHIKEPQTEYNIANNIKVHDDMMIHCINRDVKNIPFKQWLLDIYPKKELWSGSIGCQSIISKDFVNHLNDRTGIVDIMYRYNDNRLRRVAESLFPLACQYCTGKQASEISYDGLYYNGKRPPNGNSGSIICKNKYFSKISFNRRPINT